MLAVSSTGSVGWEGAGKAEVQRSLRTVCGAGRREDPVEGRDKPGGTCAVGDDDVCSAC